MASSHSGVPNHRFPRSLSSLSSLQGGTIKVAIGLGFFGLATYVFTAVVLRALGPAQFVDFNLYWGLAYGLGLGAMLPFEQEMSRRTSIAVHTGGRVNDILGAGVTVAVGFSAILALAIVPFVMHSGGQDAGWFWLVTVATFLTLGVAYVSRGGMSGQGFFGRYSWQLIAEGGARLVLVASAWILLTISGPWSYAAVVPLALLVAVVLTWHREARTLTASRSRVRGVAGSVAPLMVASIISLTLVNFGPLAIRYVQDVPNPTHEGSYLAAAFIARLPIFAFAAVQAVLMPRLVRAVVKKDPADFRRSLAKVLVPTLGLGVAVVAMVAVAGPWLLRVLAGHQYYLPRMDMVLLTAAYSCYLITLILQPAAVALAKHRSSAVVWILGACTFAIAWVLPTQASTAISIAIAVVSLTVSAGLGAVVWRGLSTQVPQRTS